MIFDRLSRPKAAITESSELAAIVNANQSLSGASVTPTSAMRVSAFYACVMVLAETIAQLPLILYERSGNKKDRAIARNLYYLLHDAPNDFQTSFDWRLGLTVDVCLEGAGYSFINRSATTNEILELLPLRANRVQVKQNKDYSIWYVFTDSDGVEIPLRQDQVFRLNGLTFDGVKGLSILDYQRETIGMAISTNKNSAKSFSNGAKLSGILSHPTRLKDEEVSKRIRESWDSAFSGDDAYKTALLEEGMTWQQVSMTNKDAQYLESRKFSIEEIARIFRMPPHKIGHLEKSTNNNIEHQGLEFVTDTMMPWFKRWEQSIARDLIGKDNRKKYFAEFLVDGLMRGDSAARASFYQTMIQNAVYSPNEVRRKENENPYKGGDVYFRPMNMEPIGTENDISQQKK